MTATLTEYAVIFEGNPNFMHEVPPEQLRGQLGYIWSHLIFGQEDMLAAAQSPECTVSKIEFHRDDERGPTTRTTCKIAFHKHAVARIHNWADAAKVSVTEMIRQKLTDYHFPCSGSVVSVEHAL